MAVAELNVRLAQEQPTGNIVAVEQPEDIFFEYNATLDDVRKELHETVTVLYENTVTRDVKVSWSNEVEWYKPSYSYDDELWIELDLEGVVKKN